MNMDDIKVPNHVAIILDGNGRWAKKKGMPRAYGHAVGADNVEKIARASDDLGIRYLTMYAFSTENWNRPKAEVATLMRLFGEYIEKCIVLAKKNNIRVRLIGETENLSESLQEKIFRLEDSSKDFTGLTLVLAINYGSRYEIARASRLLAQKVKEGIISYDDITEEMIQKHLFTSDIPDPDLLIRTSGEQRVSNFLLWQLAYTEFYFTDVPWPEFTKADLEKAIEAYHSRDRRYGKVKS